MLRRIILFLLRPKWVVFTTADDHVEELGLMIWGVIFALYKGEVYTPTSALCSIRPPQKREFGESLHQQQPLE